MKFLIGCQYIGAVIGAIAGIIIGMTATTIFLQMLGAVVFGLSAVGIAVLSHAIYAGELAEEQTRLLREISGKLTPPTDMQSPILREIRDRLPPPPQAAQATHTAEPARARPAGPLAPLPADPAAPRAEKPAKWGTKECRACYQVNDEYAERCSRCRAAFPPKN